VTTPVLVIASRNAKKVGEIAGLLAAHDVTVQSVDKFDGVPDVVEDGETFAENAALKATQTARVLCQWTLGEDSGLCVDALDGGPGIRSARFSGEDADDLDNNRLLIQRLRDVPQQQRGACYVCHVAVSDPAGEVRLSVEATCRGRIVDQARGENGFGYDPHFLLREYHLTFGELAPVVKQYLSHRARAFARLIPELVGLLSG
jgi:XTP/dITP diphosphohydrolase